MTKPFVGIIGGTGLGEALCENRTGGTFLHVETPFGHPSSPITTTQWQNISVAFLSRHGPGHGLNPSAVPYRANIFALKKIGVTHIIASGATGSLRENIHPGDLVIADQVIDKTFRRAGTFFDEGLAVHTEFAKPFCPHLRDILIACGQKMKTQVHDRGTYVCMEGPQFSTVAESNMHRNWGGDLIGMTCMPEAKLAREAEMCYALVALPTDYDCWRPHDPTQNAQALLEEIRHNLSLATEQAIELVKASLDQLAGATPVPCPCQNALGLAIWSNPQKINKKQLAPLKPLLSKYIDFND